MARQHQRMDIAQVPRYVHQWKRLFFKEMSTFLYKKIMLPRPDSAVGLSV